MSDLPKSWARVPITEILELNNNGKPFQQGWSPQCHPHPAAEESWGVLRTTAIQPGEFWSHENKELPGHLEGRPHIEVKPGDVLMTCAGPRVRCGVACLVTDTRPKLMMSGKMYRFRPHPKAMAAKFLMYFLHAHATQLEIDRMKTGINDSGLNLTHDRFATLRIPVAPLSEQRRIVARIEELFSELDKGVEALTTTREQLRAYRQSVLKAAFVGELTAADTASWTEQTVGQLVTDVRYGTAKKCAVDPSKTPVLRIPNVASGRIDLSDIKHADFDEEELEKLRLAEGDILIVRSNGSASLVGLSAIVTDDAVGCAYAGYLIRLRLRREIVLPEFLNLYLHSPWVRAGIERQARSSSGVHNINSDEIRAIVVRIPPLLEQRKIVVAVDSLLSQIESIQACADTELHRGVALRQAILQRAFSGQLVAQDSKDESASVLLNLLKETVAASKSKKVGGVKPSAIVVPFPHKIPSMPVTDLHAGIIALAYDHHAKKPGTLKTFGHVKAEKIVHLVEYHLGIDLERAPVKDAAGPNDYRRLLKVEHRASKKNWFGVQRSGARYVFTKKHGFTNLLSAVSQALGEHSARVEALIQKFLPMDTQQAEIFATVYAAWNNLMLTGNASPSDEEIVTEARESWTESKLKIERQKFFSALGWIKKNDLVPRGIGRVVEAKAQ